MQTTGLTPRLAISGSEPSLDTLDVNTLGGTDTVNVGTDVRIPINPVVDLGADQ